MLIPGDVPLCAMLQFLVVLAVADGLRDSHAVSMLCCQPQPVSRLHDVVVPHAHISAKSDHGENVTLQRPSLDLDRFSISGNILKLDHLGLAGRHGAGDRRCETNQEKCPLQIRENELTSGLESAPTTRLIVDGDVPVELCIEPDVRKDIG